MRDTVPPAVFLSDPQALLAVKGRLAAGDPALAPAFDRLRQEADAALDAGPFSVMEKATLPPSGDKHDYLSVGPYWWPDPARPDGKPYIRRDGEVNPERDRYDNVPLGRLCAAVTALALAYYLSDREPYAAHAARLVRAWFLDEATRMHPHLEYGQAIPGICDGRGIGIIDTRELSRLVDAIGLLGGSPAWTAADRAALAGWFRQYLGWLLESDHGRDEGAQHNNHGTWYDVQVASFALFAGEDAIARRALAESAPRRIAAQIEPDGRQPYELARTRSLGYSTMNLLGLFDLATLGDRVGADLWDFRTDDGRGIRQATAWLCAGALGATPWPYPQITPFEYAGLLPLLRRAAMQYGDPTYEERIARLPGVDAAADRTNLLYPHPAET